MTFKIQKIAQLLSDFEGQTAIVLSLDGSVLLSLRPNLSFPSASLIKLLISDYIMTEKPEALANKVSLINSDFGLAEDDVWWTKRKLTHFGAGILDVLSGNNQTITVAQLQTLMLTISDNWAANALIRYFGMAEINHFASSRYTNTHLRRQFMAQTKLDNETTASDSLSMLKNVLEHSSTNYLLTRQQSQYKLPGTFIENTSAPFQDLTIFNKTGEGATVDHDAMSIVFDNHQLDVVLLTKTSASHRFQRLALFNNISHVLWDEMILF